MVTLSPVTLVITIIVYFLVLIAISVLTNKNSDNTSFFTANRNSPWFLVSFGMIGASLSGVTFISIPGAVGGSGLNEAFSYMQMVFGYLLGYIVIAYVLLPIYYKYNLTTIYGFLEKRFGVHAYKTGAAYFILSRVVGSAFRMYLVALVLDTFVFKSLGIPFEVTTIITILLILIYTFKGGIKTIVITDTFQTIVMLLTVALTIYYVAIELNQSLPSMLSMVRESPLSAIWHLDSGWNDPNNFFKQFISGALITLVMTGLDQDMMQKNLTCRNLKDAQKNMMVFSVILVFTNLLFLTMGACLYLYGNQFGINIPGNTDVYYPTIALQHMPVTIGFLFILGLIAAAYSSADSALTALTTSFCIDFLNFEKSQKPESHKKRTRILVHLGFAILLALVIIIFQKMNNTAIINNLFKAAGYTYGPLLGLFAFAILTRRNLPGIPTVMVCLIAPILSYIINDNAATMLNGFSFGNLIIALNGIITFFGLYLISSNKKP
ncbi:MAG: sodium:solute symporter [Saprospiraceae bacterium]|nr:sodium:solute symporter [Saprospiraceae bacterium]MBK7523420.1 sodium:solute symporter [Saprospiraceae bacterium]MBK8371591.1 sodium:solute symporter [Saprospiraceae bacterium]MBK8548855.1 sodium:solute symporter [Saprospiraceae bacterium]MBK8818966.1 sodium:solute symporter [Saprospiraceae bacterium]